MLVTLVAFLFIGFLHIPFSFGIYFIPIKSIEILNVTNCDRFREAAIISNVTVTPARTLTAGPEEEAGQDDGDGGIMQTVSISFTNDAALDQNAVLSISDMKPDRTSIQDTESPSKWIRNKLYIDRHNLCDILNNYLATAIFGKHNHKSRNKTNNNPEHIYNEETNTNNIRSNNPHLDTEERSQRKFRLCPIVAGHCVLPKFKWKTPSVSVPAIFLGYQRFVIEVINPLVSDISNPEDNILMCKIVTVFLHPKKTYN